MATFNGLFTIGKDCELRQTSGDDVATLSLAYNYGRKQDGKQPTQWIRATLWGKRATALSSHLTKGKQIYASLTDVHVREYDGQNGKGYSMEATISDLEFARGQPQQGQQAAPARQQQRAASGFDDSDDIPW